MSHYVIIDGQLQRSSLDTQRWASRAGKSLPSNSEPPADVVAITERPQSDYEIIQGIGGD